MITSPERKNKNEVSFVLVAGGIDPSGGAGLAVDILAVSAAGAIAMPVATSLTAQSMKKAYAAHPVETEIIAEQLRAVEHECKPKVIKTGLIQSAETAKLLADFAHRNSIPIVVDPILKSSSGYDLAGTKAADFIKKYLSPEAYLITPNAMEAEALTGVKVIDAGDAQRAAKDIAKTGAKNVLITGGHMENGSDICRDYLYNGNNFIVFTAQRELYENVRGTGCMLAAAIAGFLSKGKDLEESIAEAKRLVSERIASYGKESC